MDITLVNPNIVTQKGDFFSSGIPYMPITIAYLAAYLRNKGHTVTIIDAFGAEPTKVTTFGNYFIQGLTPEEIVFRIPKNTEVLFFYASLVVTHENNLRIIQHIRKSIAIPIIVVENTQSVVAYSLRRVSADFFNAGANFIITGEAEYRTEKLLQSINSKQTSFYEIDGLVYQENNIIMHQPKTEFIQNIDDLPFPAWDLFPIENYWKLKYSHGPFSGEKYLPLLTSRGCTLPCKFCIVPETNNQKWRPRSARNVFEEMLHWHEKYGVTEFHIEDLNPTINKNRMVELSQLILDNNLKIIWKFAAGTKIETLDKNAIETMAKAGCTYVSLSPESGSPQVLQSMKKPFNHKHGTEMVEYMNKLGITTQACFVLGFPGETDEDLLMTQNYIKELTKAGVDEVAMFIMTPIPGSETTGQVKGYDRLEQLTFSPSWRQDYKKLNKFRWITYAKYFFWKLRYHPTKLFQQPFNIFTRRFKTKMEMTTFRAAKMWKLSRTK